MRTMLIPLILVCSLAQFAIADPEPIDSGDCGPTYTCFAPKKCRNWRKTLIAENVVRIDNEEIYDNCDAIFRFHEYGTQRAHIIMESYLPTVKTIEFHQTDSSNVVKNKFTCKVGKNSNNEDIAVGMWQVGTSQDKQMYTGEVPHGTNDKLKCEFEAKKSHGRATFFDKKKDDTKKDKLFFNIDGAVTQFMEDDRIDSPRCDPENLEYISEFNETKLYKSVQFKAGLYFCDKTHPYKFEYRLNPAESYEEIKSFGCKAANDYFFYIDKDGITKDITDPNTVIDIRCAVDTEYFCKYTPKEFGSGTKLQGRYLTESDTHKKSELECPSTARHLVIKSTTGGLDKLILNADKTHFECVSLDALQVWRAGKSLLKEKGPPVYCTSEVDCNLVWKIPDNAVKNGRLNDVGLPICFTEGTLYVNTKAPQNLVTNPRCDKSSGDFMYTAGGADHKVTGETKFVCEYPRLNNDEKNADNAKIVAFGAAGAAGGVAGVVGLAIGLSTFCMWYRLRKERQLRAKEHARANVKFAMNSEEAAAYLKEERKRHAAELKAGKLAEQILEEQSAKDELWNWNEMQMSNQHNCRAKFVRDQNIAVDSDGKCAKLSFKPKQKQKSATGNSRCPLPKPADKAKTFQPKNILEKAEKAVDNKKIKKRDFMNQIAGIYVKPKEEGAKAAK